MFTWAEKFWNKFIDVAGWGNFSISQVYLFTGITVAGFIIELIFTGWKNSSLKHLLKPGKSERTDIVMWFISMFNINRILGVLFTFGICYYTAGKLSKLGHFNLIIHLPGPALQFIVLLLIGDLKNYGRHYVFHHFGPLWMAHQFHHSAEEFVMITQHRNHFLESAFGMLFDVIPFVLLGSSPQSFFLVQALRDLHQMMVHGRWRTDWGWVGKYVLVSPNAHLLHHSVSEKHYGKNFGSLFIFWDRIFGTYHAPENTTIGQPQSGYNEKGVANDFWLGYKNVAGHFRAIIKKTFKTPSQ